MDNINTGWAPATADPNIAMSSLISCLESGKNAWIEVRKNGDQTHPVMMPNPLLDDPFNWEMDYGTLRIHAKLDDSQFVNETEKDLTLNWISCFGTKEAVEQYQKTGTVIEGLVLGGSISCPVKIKDANAYRRDITGDCYRYNHWVTFWKPKNGIVRQVIDDRIDGVFTICYDDRPMDKKKALIRAAQFMLAYAGKL